jgi:hypothetical protein
MLGPGALPHPGDQQTIDLLLAGVGVAAPQVLPHHAPSRHEEIEGGSQLGGGGGVGVGHFGSVFCV